MFIDRVNELRTQPIYDYKIVGSIGFSNIAVETWKKILNKIRELKKTQKVTIDIFKEWKDKLVYDRDIIVDILI